MMKILVRLADKLVFWRDRVGYSMPKFIYPILARFTVWRDTAHRRNIEKAMENYMKNDSLFHPLQIERDFVEDKSGVEVAYKWRPEDKEIDEKQT